MANETPYDVQKIVESYIHDKLLKKGFKWENHTGCNDSARPSNGLGNRSSSSSASSSSSFGSDSVRQRSHILPTHLAPEAAPPDDSSPATQRLQCVLRDAGDEVERLYWREFTEMCGQLHFTPSTAQRRFTGVVEELFRDGINWGRIMAFLEFGGTMCVESVNREMTAQVDNIARWMTDSLNAPPLRRWIEENGGWGSFVELYGSRQRGAALRHTTSYRTIFGLLALGAAGVTIGTLLSQK